MTREEYINTLELDNAELKKENQELKSQLKGTTHCFDEEEHRKLKKQLEDANEMIILLKASEPMLNYKKALEETQQKEFIDYLQKEINRYNAHIDAVNSVGVSIYSTDYDNSKLKLAIFKEVLLKYIETIQTKNDKFVRVERKGDKMPAIEEEIKEVSDENKTTI